MHRLSILILVFALVALNAAFMPAGTVAQDATPGAGPARADRAVPVEECQVEPRAADEVFGLIGLVEGAEASPAARTPVPAPPWTAADDEAATAAETTAREWLACINADDNLRIAALMTDGALTRFFAGAMVAAEQLEEAQARLTETPAPRAEEEQVRLVSVSDVAVLDDGRIVALAVINEPALRPHGQETLLLVFDPTGERYLLDDIVQFSIVPPRAGTPAAATPVTGTPVP
ncbi:MAG: hypothetical protein K0S78_3984 [Thermomicrobiales bacterium]|nr:hypothetical protein [Thermomicrobiales bacterium]